jgi:subtilisin family serine protease
MEIKKIFLTGTSIVVLFILGLFISCDVDICIGFEGEPYVFFAHDSAYFEVVYSNNNVSNRISSGKDFIARAPFDMNANQMKYDFYTPDYRGSLIIDYELEPQQCSETDEILIVFKNASINESSSFRNIYYAEYNGYSRIDSIPNLAQVLTSYSGYGQELLVKY